MSEPSLPIGDLLNSLMANPEMLQKAMNIAGSLASSGILNGLMSSESGHSERSEPSPSSPHAGEERRQSGKASEFSSLGDLLSGLTGQKHESDRSEREHHPAEHEKSKPSAPRVCHADRIRLLQSLRPFLPCDKQEKIDFVIKLLGLLDAAERMGLGRIF